MHFWKLHKVSILFAFISILFYMSFAYDLARTDALKLLSLYAALFFLFYKIVQTTPANFKFLVALALIFRVVFLFAIPNLSQDFYRFIWDGRMILEGLNPFLYTPESFINAGKFPVLQAQELYNGMGILNGSHFTNYPPIKQFVFWVTALFSGKSILGAIIVMRLFIITADVGILYFGKKLLEKLNIPIQNIFWYLLNPFIIIELTGNLHFEGIMLFFLIWSLYLLHCGKWRLAAVIFALSISVKLIPLLFLPLLHQKLGFKKSVGFYGIVAVITSFLFLPFYSSEFITNYSKTVELWFSDFEFNASIYYIMRSIGYEITGFNQIAFIAKYLALSVLIFVIAISYIRKNKATKNLIITMLFAASFYYFTATTVHPWYLATLLILSVFTNYKFPLVWSFVIILSYLAYANTDNSENFWIIGLEYSIVYGILFFELFKKKDGLYETHFSLKQ